MSDDVGLSWRGALVTSLRSAVFGVTDPRVRATWRVLLAWPLLPFVGVVVALVMPVLGVSGMIPGGPLQGVVFLAILVAWARYLDRRPLSDYGVSASRAWASDLLVGFAVVVGVWSGWHALAASLGWMQVEVATTALRASAAFEVVGVLVSLAVNTWVQDVVFFAIVLATAAQGFRSRGVDPTRAVVGGWLVGILFFTAIHPTPTGFDALATAVGGAVFGLLYVHTGELALTIGVHWGASYVVSSIFAARGSARASLFEVTRTLPGDFGGEVRIVLYLATYLLLVGWLAWRRGEVSVEEDVARWTRR